MTDEEKAICPRAECHHLLLLHDIAAYGTEGDALVCKVCYANGQAAVCKHNP